MPLFGAIDCFVISLFYDRSRLMKRYRINNQEGIMMTMLKKEKLVNNNYEHESENVSKREQESAGADVREEKLASLANMVRANLEAFIC